MSFIYSFSLFLLIFFLEISFLGSFRILSLIPNLILMLLVIFSVYDQKNRLLLFGIFFGFLMDLTSSLPFGTHLLFYLITIFIVQFFTKGAGLSTPTSLVMGLFIGISLLYGIVQGVIFSLNGGPMNFGILKISVLQVLFDTLTGFLMYVFSSRYFDAMKTIDIKFDQKVKR